MKNIGIVFPEMPRKRKKQIAWAFYHHFMEMWMETIKMLDMSEEDINEHVKFVEDDTYKKIKSYDKPIIFYTTHLFNWEWMCAATQLNVFQSLPVYKRLANRGFDKLIYDIRSKFGATPIRQKVLLRQVRKITGLSGIGLLADQTPISMRSKIWSVFMGRETPFYRGTMILPYFTQFPCYFAEVTRTGRGKYLVKFIEMSPPPYKKNDFRIFDEYIQLSQTAIRNHPEDYLWTHNRWKYNRKEKEEIIIFPS